jgi:MoaA/NifB/PqqE/SkfB family radical SAM enzyme
MGHLVNLAPLARGLRHAGHCVAVALRDLSRAERMFEGLGLLYFQAPVKTRPTPDAIQPQRSLPHILHNSGFGDPLELKALAEAWRNLYLSVRPDLVIFDHSPTALLAARGISARRVLIGMGFFCPADEYPLPDLRPWQPPEPERLRQDEDRVLSHANGVLASWGQPPLERLSQLYCEVDENFLTSFPELEYDPGRLRQMAGNAAPLPAAARPDEPAFSSSQGWTQTDTLSHDRALETLYAPPREATRSPGNGEKPMSALAAGALRSPPARYWGTLPHMGNATSARQPEWPQGRGKRIFAYLKPFPALAPLLEHLGRLGCPTIVYGDEIDPQLRERFGGGTIRFEVEPLDMVKVGKTCDLAILNGTAGTTATILLAGRPVLQVPISLEQGHVAMAVGRLGAGLMASSDRPERIVDALTRMLASETYAEAARRFAARHANFDPQRQVAGMLGRIEALLRHPTARPAASSWEVRFLQVEPTTRCNFACAFCAGRHLAQRDIDFDVFEAALRCFPRIRHLELQGEGEPLLHPRFFDMVRLAKRLHPEVRVSTVTNGSLLSRENIDQILDAGLHKLHVSLESADPAVFQEVRGGHLEKIIESITALMAARRQRGSDHPAVGFAVTLLRRTRAEIPRLVSLYESLGLDGGLLFQPLQTMPAYTRYYSAETLAQLLSPGDAEEIRRTAAQDATVVKVLRRPAAAAGFWDELFAGWQPASRTCPWLVKGMYLSADGSATSCCFQKDATVNTLGMVGQATADQLMEKRAEFEAKFRQGESPAGCCGCSIARAVVGHAAGASQTAPTQPSLGPGAT